MWRGEPSRRLRSVYAQARRHPAAIVFVDEIDAIGSARSSGPGALHDDNTTVDALLVELDGFGSTTVLTIGATNNANGLDPALLRPGRFDRILTFGLPELDSRRQILERHLSKTKTDGPVDLSALARATTGCAPAELMNIVKEGGLMALREGRTAIAQGDLQRGLERVAMGSERRTAMTDSERRVVAYHESGHALATLMLDPSRELRKVSIVGNSRGALGFTWGVPTEETHLRSERDYLNEISIALAGVAAERLVFTVATDGAAGDLQVVGGLARRMVHDCGMGGVLFRSEVGSESLRQHLDNEMRRITETCYRDVWTLLERHRPALDRLAAALLANETLTGSEVSELIGSMPAEYKALSVPG